MATAAPSAAAPPPHPPPPFYEWREHWPELQFLVDAYREIRAEAAATDPATWREWPERNLYKADQGHEWRVVPFCYTFPADDVSRRQWVASACDACPRTAALLRRLGPSLRTALFSRMAPHTSLASHQGWSMLANHVLRLHLPLDVPDDGLNVSGVIVEDAIRYHREGQLMVFDDSLVHSAFNNHQSRYRTVLIFDLARPPGAAPGSATGGTTAELQDFVSSYFH
jgi:hypothetical protein